MANRVLDGVVLVAVATHTQRAAVHTLVKGNDPLVHVLDEAFRLPRQASGMGRVFSCHKWHCVLQSAAENIRHASLLTVTVAFIASGIKTREIDDAISQFDVNNIGNQISSRD